MDPATVGRNEQTDHILGGSVHLKRHMSDKHGIRVVWHKCDVRGCEDKFKQKSDLKQHMSDRHGIRVVWHECDFPGYKDKFKRKCDLKRHMSNRHGIRVVWHECDVRGCKDKFKRKCHLKRHKAYIHDIDVVWHECDVTGCEDKFKQKSDLHSHMKRMHNGVYCARMKTQEENVRIALTNAGYKECFQSDNIPPIGSFKREKYIDFRCAEVQSSTINCRIDFVLSLPGGLVFLEVDEDQHRYGYDGQISCDMKRMSHAMESLFIEMGDSLPYIYWLRYNPNAYRVDGELVSVNKRDREARLVAWLSHFEVTSPMGIGYAFYDSEDGILDVLYNAEYSQYYTNIVEDLGQLL